MYAEKLLPHDIEAEEAVIGSLLLDGESILKVAHFLKAGEFYREKNRFCYEACLDLFRRSEAINQVTVAYQLTRQERIDEVGGTAYLSHLVSTVPTPVHVEYYGRIVNRTAVMRNLIEAGAQIAGVGYEGTDDVGATLNRAEDILLRVRTGQPTRDFVPIREILDQYMEEQATIGEPTGRMGVPIMSGFGPLDDLLGAAPSLRHDSSGGKAEPGQEYPCDQYIPERRRERKRSGDV